MKNFNKYFKFIILSLYVGISGTASAGDVWDKAFPKVDYFGSNYSSTYVPMQGTVGTTEVLAGAGLAGYTAFHGKNLSMASLLLEESMKSARADMGRTDLANAKLLDARDSTNALQANLDSRIREIDDYVKNGRQVQTGYQPTMQVGNMSIPGHPIYSTEYPSPAEKIVLATERAKLVPELKAAEQAYLSAKAAAKPAEDILVRKTGSILADIKAGKLTPAEKAILRSSKLRLAGEVGAIALSTLLLVDGSLRVVAILNERDPGISPAVRLGSDYIKKGVGNFTNASPNFSPKSLDAH